MVSVSPPDSKAFLGLYDRCTVQLTVRFGDPNATGHPLRA